MTDLDPLAQLPGVVRRGARRGRCAEPEAAALATATPDGRPSVRIVLLSGIDARGVAFYTNYESRKGRELAANPRAALAFHWPALERQVRIEGPVERVPAEESDAYFAAPPARQPARRVGLAAEQRDPRPRVARGRASPSSTARFPGEDVPRPPYWGGYRLRPGRDRVLAGPPEPPARPHPLPARADGGWRAERLLAVTSVPARAASSTPDVRSAEVVDQRDSRARLRGARPSAA